MDTSNDKPSSIDQKIDAILIEKRRIFFSSAVDMESAEEVIRKLWYLDAIAPQKPILLIINSPGGSVDAGFAVWDQIKMLSSPVSTLVTGMAASMGSLLSLVAEPGKRYATPYARFMMHQPSIHGVVQGQATDLAIQAQQIIKSRDLIIEIYASALGKTKEFIRGTLERDTWLSALEAKEMGHIDHIVSSYLELPDFA